MGPLGLISVLYIADLAFQPTNYTTVPQIDLTAALQVAGDPFSATTRTNPPTKTSESPVDLLEALGMLDGVTYVEWRGHLIIID